MICNWPFTAVTTLLLSSVTSVPPPPYWNVQGTNQQDCEAVPGYSIIKSAEDCAAACQWMIDPANDDIQTISTSFTNNRTSWGWHNQKCDVLITGHYDTFAPGCILSGFGTLTFAPLTIIHSQESCSLLHNCVCTRGSGASTKSIKDTAQVLSYVGGITVCLLICCWMLHDKNICCCCPDVDVDANNAQQESDPEWVAQRQSSFTHTNSKVNVLRASQIERGEGEGSCRIEMIKRSVNDEMEKESESSPWSRNKKT
jgi:hypothetical protein